MCPGVAQVELQRERVYAPEAWRAHRAAEAELQPRRRVLRLHRHAGRGLHLSTSQLNLSQFSH